MSKRHHHHPSAHAQQYHWSAPPVPPPYPPYPPYPPPAGNKIGDVRTWLLVIVSAVSLLSFAGQYFVSQDRQDQLAVRTTKIEDAVLAMQAFMSKHETVLPVLQQHENFINDQRTINQKLTTVAETLSHHIKDSDVHQGTSSRRLMMEESLSPLRTELQGVKSEQRLMNEKIDRMLSRMADYLADRNTGGNKSGSGGG